MPDPKTIKEVYERNRKAVEMRPSRAQSTGISTVRVKDGTTCQVEGGGRNLIVDISREAGGNDAGPGPGVFERAALGGCLAMGYVQQAALAELPLDSIEVDVETDFDARGMLGAEDRPPGFTRIRYTVRIKSPAPEAEVRKIIDAADRLSPVRDDFSRSVPLHREVRIESTQSTPS